MADWRNLFHRRLSDVEEPVGKPARVVMFDPKKLHPAWVPGVGFELRLGDGPPVAVGVDGVLSRIAAIRLVGDDEEADRLQAEFDGLLAIRARVEASNGEACG